MARNERSAGVVVFRAGENDRREFLLLDNGRFWDFPKGHVEKGETDLQAAGRELFEEACIGKPKWVEEFAHQIRYFFKDRKTLVAKTVVYFLAETKDEKVRISDEHVGFEFLEYSAARARLKYANAREILRLAEEHLSSGREGA